MATNQKPVGNYYRVLKPSGAHKSYRFQERDGNGKWTTLHTDDTNALNKRFKDGTLSEADANNRADKLLAGLYRERDRGKIQPTIMPGNFKILQKFVAEKYDAAKKKRMYKRSYNGEVRRLTVMLESLANTPIDGPIGDIQDSLDKNFSDDHGRHKRMTICANRMRKWLGMKHAQHLRVEVEMVKYISMDRFLKGLKTCPDPDRTMAAVAFYTGLRRSEIWGLEDHDLVGDVLKVERQIHPDAKESGGTVLPKNRKKRKAYILPGGEEWVKRWLDMKKNLSRFRKVVYVKQHFGVGLHDLRHSYAVHLIGKGATLDWVARSLGHSRETCERDYAGHVLTDDAIDLLRKLG